MEPKFSLSAYATAICAGLIGLAMRGFPGSTLGIGVGVALWGVALYVLYRLSARSAARRLKWARRRPHRRALDKVVILQLAAIVAVGATSAVTCEAGDFSPAAHSSVVLQASILGAVIIACTAYMSALIDWFWVLPKIAGITREPPCVLPGGEKCAGVTAE